MTPEQAYEWLAPKLSRLERQALDLIYQAIPSAPSGQWGCHCDLEPGQKPDECVLDYNRPEDCIHAETLVERGKDKTACAYWRPITNLDSKQ